MMWILIGVGVLAFAALCWRYDRRHHQAGEGSMDLGQAQLKGEQQIWELGGPGREIGPGNRRWGRGPR